jgi:predicted ABC-type transport system involved in lysophospholipase L1 biosynthesis ATPase subunit
MVDDVKKIKKKKKIIAERGKVVEFIAESGKGVEFIAESGEGVEFIAESGKGIYAICHSTNDLEDASTVREGDELVRKDDDDTQKLRGLRS